MNTPPGGSTYRRERFSKTFARLKEELQPAHPFDYDIIPFYAIGSAKQSMPDIDSYDAYILSGSSRNLSERGIPELYTKEIKLIARTRKPILGICFGHQLLAFTHGFIVGKMEDRTIEANDGEITLALPRGFLLTPKKVIRVQVFHSEEVKYTKDLENSFFVLSSSQHCKVHVIQHKRLPHFGVQFHPEASDTASAQTKMNGEEILRNFVTFAVDYDG